MAGSPGEWVWKFKLMLTQPPTELELELAEAELGKNYYCADRVYFL